MNGYPPIKYYQLYLLFPEDGTWSMFDDEKDVIRHRMSFENVFSARATMILYQSLRGVNPL